MQRPGCATPYGHLATDSQDRSPVNPLTATLRPPTRQMPNAGGLPWHPAGITCPTGADGHLHEGAKTGRPGSADSCYLVHLPLEEARPMKRSLAREDVLAAVELRWRSEGDQAPLTSQSLHKSPGRFRGPACDVRGTPGAWATG
jgi:hypothetical protein